MPRIHVEAGRPLLEQYVRTPPAGLCELIWNAFDEDATTVDIEIETGALGGIQAVVVRDNGGGMNSERAQLAFSKVGDSWKRAPGTATPTGRPVHGKHGRGRYSAFSIGEVARWVSTGHAVAGDELEEVVVTGRRSSLDEFQIDTATTIVTQTGTTVTMADVTAEAEKAFDNAAPLREKILTEFALHLTRHEDFTVRFLGDDIDPTTVIKKRVTLPVPLDEGILGAASITIIEWSLSNVERRLYLCMPGGATVDEMRPGVQAPGSEFTAYLEWPGFADQSAVVIDLDGSADAARVVEAGKVVLRDYLSEAGRMREAETISRWQAEGVYPYKGKPKDSVEKAARDTFNVVALVAARTVDESKSRGSRALALSLLKETFENDPEALLPILREFSQLPQNRIEELKEILERTSLTQLIALGKEIGNRVDFIQGINALLFEPLTKRTTLERRQLHRVLAHETWLFGEEWSITGDDQRLSQVLLEFLNFLGLDAELASGPEIRREDDSIAIPDLVLGRQLQTNENLFAHLVIELKRPNHTLTDADVSQLRSYASAITNDDRFDQPNSSWDFWLVGNDMARTVDEQRDKRTFPPGVVQVSSRYRVIVRTWAEIIGDAEHRLKFVQTSLQYESGRDLGLKSLREKYGKYLPPEALTTEAPEPEQFSPDAA